MTATPLQNQGAQTLGAENATPDAQAPLIDADQEIIAKVLGGHKDSFGTLITRYSDPLYRHALGMTGSPDVAEDILQASFIKAYQHLGEVRGRFDAWVFRIVANSCKDWLKNIRRTHVSYDEDDQPSTYSTPEEEMDRNELRTDLQFALARLAPSLREAFVMKHVEGRSYEEMALLLETTVGALKMRVHRAREALQQLLEEKYARCSMTQVSTEMTRSRAVSPFNERKSPPSSSTTAKFRSMESLVTVCCMTGWTVRWI
jgi:RNA polymerase sigma-70 factor (ECF subfamily)